MGSGTILRTAIAAASLAWALPVFADDLDMQSEIKIANDGLQKVTEKIGCLVTASDMHGPEMTKILDVLNESERKLRDARRTAETASTPADRMHAIEQARSSRALVNIADGYRAASGIN